MLNCGSSRPTSPGNITALTERTSLRAYYHLIKKKQRQDYQTPIYHTLKSKTGLSHAYLSHALSTEPLEDRVGVMRPLDLPS